MELTDNQLFKNEYTKRFHDYFYYKLKNKELNADEFYTRMGVSDNTRFVFFSAMRKGKSSITAEHIRISLEKYGVRPDYFFGVSVENIEVDMNHLNHSKELIDMIQSLKQGLNALEKKITNG